MNKIAVIDYGMGNLHSVAKSVEHVGQTEDLDLRIDVTSDPKIIANADRVIFPGVGAIRDCMSEIRRLGIDDIVADVIERKPLLAICVGFQALMDFSEENEGVDCLGIAKGSVKYFGGKLCDESGHALKVPHMGWNCVEQATDHPLWDGIPDNSRFYFVHSYYVAADSSETLAGVTNYGLNFASALEKGNIFAVQFHPEKSHIAGLALLKNFLLWEGVQ
ncbi:MAG: imidazole glycerol phosphate synthase subunit HisH [Gammaproteobacteria bacterium]|nr:imidazole glycerol phosphate synthase subunit HisH [Gammaproteobacteria bacterium]